MAHLISMIYDPISFEPRFSISALALLAEKKISVQDAQQFEELPRNFDVSENKSQTTVSLTELLDQVYEFRLTVLKVHQLLNSAALGQPQSITPHHKACTLPALSFSNTSPSYRTYHHGLRFQSSPPGQAR